MATLYAGTEGPVRMDAADISTWLTGSVYDNSPTHMSISSPGGSYRIFGGTGFTFDPSGIFTGGTVTSFYVSTGGGGEPTGVVGMSMSVAALKNYVSTGNSDGFLAAVFAGNDTLNGHSYYVFDDFLRGYNGHDVINGGAGNDTLWGDAGNDKLNGGTGDDFLDGGAGTDTLSGGKGNDGYAIGSTADTVVELAGEGTDLLYASISVDLNVIGGGFVENAFLNGTANLNATGNGLGNALAGNSGANKLSGNLGNDSLFGLDGNDSLDGGLGIDNMQGGKGNDTYYVDSSDTVDETGGTGLDTVIASVDFSLNWATGDVENLTLLVGAGNLSGQGNGLANKITGNDGENDLHGFAGNDTINGGGATDHINGGLGNDSLNGGLGNDVIDGGHGTNTINVASGNDTVNHSAFVDAYDIIQTFDGNATGGQDVLDLDIMFDALGVAAGSRAARVQLTDKGASVDVKIDTDGNGSFEYLAATINSSDAIAVGTDVLVGS